MLVWNIIPALASWVIARITEVGSPSPADTSLSYLLFFFLIVLTWTIWTLQGYLTENAVIAPEKEHTAVQWVGMRKWSCPPPRNLSQNSHFIWVGKGQMLTPPCSTATHAINQAHKVRIFTNWRDYSGSLWSVSSGLIDTQVLPNPVFSGLCALCWLVW